MGQRSGSLLCILLDNFSCTDYGLCARPHLALPASISKNNRRRRKEVLPVKRGSYKSGGRAWLTTYSACWSLLDAHLLHSNLYTFTHPHLHHEYHPVQCILLLQAGQSQRIPRHRPRAPEARRRTEPPRYSQFNRLSLWSLDPFAFALSDDDDDEKYLSLCDLCGSDHARVDAIKEASSLLSTTSSAFPLLVAATPSPESDYFAFPPSSVGGKSFPTFHPA